MSTVELNWRAFVIRQLSVGIEIFFILFKYGNQTVQKRECVIQTLYILRNIEQSMFNCQSQMKLLQTSKIPLIQNDISTYFASNKCYNDTSFITPVSFARWHIVLNISAQLHGWRFSIPVKFNCKSFSFDVKVQTMALGFFVFGMVKFSFVTACMTVKWGKNCVSTALFKVTKPTADCW